LVKSEEKVRDLTKESKALMKAVKVAKEEVKVKEAEMQQQQNKPFSLSSVFGMSTTTPSGVAPSSSTGALPTAGSGGAGAPPRRTLSTSTVDLDGGRIGVVVRFFYFYPSAKLFFRYPPTARELYAWRRES
jgi:hypothetical protein